MSRWTKKAAIARLQSNLRLSEITQIDPRIQYFIDQAILYETPSPYEPIWVYQILRNNIQKWVGLHAERAELRNSADYLIVINTLGDLLNSHPASNKKTLVPLWTKGDAIDRMNSNQRLSEILQIEPRIQRYIDDAVRQENTPSYNRITTYTYLRDRLYHLVGWHATEPALRTEEAYNTVLNVIIDLLPPDRVDLG